MRFEVAAELRTFAESVRAAIGEWEPPREPELGAWLDDRDDALAERLASVGWGELWSDRDLLGPAVAGGLELGRSVAPACLIDEAALGAHLCVAGRARHGTGATVFALPLPGGGLALGRPASEPVPEATLDGSGTVRVEAEGLEALTQVEAAARWTVWGAATLAYLAGLAERALELAVEHARTREQFSAPLAVLPAVQSRLADSALAVDGMGLVAWGSIDTDAPPTAPQLLWAGAACSEVTASVQQVHGAVGFALETGAAPSLPACARNAVLGGGCVRRFPLIARIRRPIPLSRVAPKAAGCVPSHHGAVRAPGEGRWRDDRCEVLVRVEILARREYSNRGTTIAIAEDAVENGRSESGDELDTTTVSRERAVLVAAGQSSSSRRSSATSP